MFSNNATRHVDPNQTETDSEILILTKHLLLSEKIILIFITIFTITGNTIVLVVTWKERSLHKPNKYFIACLAVADLLVGMFVAPLRLYLLKYPDYESAWLAAMSVHLCRFMVWIDTLVFTASIYTLTFISFDRYLKISKPFKYKSWMTTSTSLKVILLIWSISTGFATFAATPISGSRGILFTADFCPFDATKGFYTFMATSAFFLPTIVILVMYALIFLAAHKRQKRIRNGTLGHILNNQHRQPALIQDLKVIRMLSVVVGVFILCWGPFFTWVLLLFYNPSVFEGDENSLNHWYSVHMSNFVIVMLPLFNSLCNPIIYTCLDEKYKVALKHLFKRMLCRQLSRTRQPPNAVELLPPRRRELEQAKD